MLHLHARRTANVRQLLPHVANDLFYIRARVHVVLLPGAQVRKQGETFSPERFAVGHELGQLGVERLVRADEDRSLVRPRPRDISGRVPATAHHEHRDAETLDEAHAAPVPADVQVEAPESVVAEAVCAALEHDRGRVEGLDGGLDHVLEEVRVAFVVDAVVERHVDCIVLARIVGVDGPRGLEGSRAREKYFSIVFVEGDAHDPVGAPERLFDSIAMMHVDVDIEHARVVAEEL